MQIRYMSAPAAARAQCMQAALNHVRAVNDVLNSKVKPEEADQLKEWLFAIGRRVAEAANEGSIFGFGGEQMLKKRPQANRLRIGAAGELMFNVLIDGSL